MGDDESILEPVPPPRNEVPAASPQPASARTGPTAPIHDSRADDRFAGLRARLDLDTLLSAARACHRGRHPYADPTWPEIRPRLELAEAELLDFLDACPESRTARLYLKQVARMLPPDRNA